MSKENLSPDIYGINKYINELKKEFMPDVNEDTLMLGIFGYTGQVFSDMLQNSIVMASEFSNEGIPTKAKFEKNIIAHALGLGIDSINAVPSQMDVLLTFIEEDIINWAKANNVYKDEHGNIITSGKELPWTFVFDKNNKIYFGDYEFHTDYDIIIKKVKVTTKGNNKFAYTAQYDPDDFEIKNSISDITNPYLTPPITANIDGINVLYLKCTIRQVEKVTQSTKVLADNDVSSKTITFKFDGQLASFSLDVTEGTDKYHMVPVYDGLNVDTSGQLYFWYTYLDSNIIRIKFDRNSRIPAVNANIQINLQTTQGSKGNFTFFGEDYPEFVFESERLNYSNITCQVRPITGNALYGTDKKSISELKEIIPKEALSRGSITNLKDLENNFNMLDNTFGKLYFYKKRDNCLERLYYSFLIMKDENNIVPTNTIDIVADPADFIDFNNQEDKNSNKLVLKQGQLIRLGSNPNEEAIVLGSNGEIVELDDSKYIDNFTYYLPYDLIINKNPVYGMYILSTMHSTKALEFDYINENCIYQYISTKFLWDRNCLNNHDTYFMNISVEQNIIGTDLEDQNCPIHYTYEYELNDDGSFKLDEFNNKIIKNKNIKVDVDLYLIIYDDENNPLRWAKANILDIDTESNIINYQFAFETDNYIDTENRIRLVYNSDSTSGINYTPLYDVNSKNISEKSYFNDNMTAKLFIISKQGKNSSSGISIKEIIPEIDDSIYSLSNIYNIPTGLDFFYDYTEIVKSIVTQTEDGKYHISGVPVVKYDYLSDEDVAKQFYSELVSRKAYIDDAVMKLEDAFEMDFKFFNTYGPSRFFTWDNLPATWSKEGTNAISRVNISIFFNIKLKATYPSNIIEDITADIKNYIEDIDNIQSIHIPNLVTEITNKYKDYIVFFEFVSINGQPASNQHIYSIDVSDGIVVPEFINVNIYKDSVTGALLPDITITEV